MFLPNLHCRRLDTHSLLGSTVVTEFALPEVGHSQSIREQEVWDDMETVKEGASSSMGLCIRIGQAWKMKGIRRSGI